MNLTDNKLLKDYLSKYNPFPGVLAHSITSPGAKLFRDLSLGLDLRRHVTKAVLTLDDLFFEFFSNYDLDWMETERAGLPGYMQNALKKAEKQVLRGVDLLYYPEDLGDCP